METQKTGLETNNNTSRWRLRSFGLGFIVGPVLTSQIVMTPFYLDTFGSFFFEKFVDTNNLSIANMWTTYLYFLLFSVIMFTIFTLPFYLLLFLLPSYRKSLSQSDSKSKFMILSIFFYLFGVLIGTAGFLIYGVFYAPVIFDPTTKGILQSRIS